jgi:hypothetical protein
MFDPGIAKHRLKSPMRTECNEAGRLLAAVPLQDPFYCRFQIVVSEAFENSAKSPECQFMPFEKCLLCGPKVRSMIRAAASHAAHLENLQTGPFSPEISIGFVPINLPFRSPGITLRYTRLAPYEAQGKSALADIFADRPLADVAAGNFLFDPLPDPMCRMPLLSRCATVCLQHRFNQRNIRLQLPMRPIRFLAPQRNGIADGISDHSTMDTELACYVPN